MVDKNEDLAEMYEESRAMFGIGAENVCEEKVCLWKRALFYGSAALIGLILRFVLKRAGFL